MGQSNHRAMNLNVRKNIVFTAMSKRSFYFRNLAAAKVLEKGYIPISPFGNFDYFLTDNVDRDLVREANNNLLLRCDEVWVIGPISDGVYAEITLAKQNNIPVRYFQIILDSNIAEVAEGEEVYENFAL